MVLPESTEDWRRSRGVIHYCTHPARIDGGGSVSACSHSIKQQVSSVELHAVRHEIICGVGGAELEH